MRARWMRPIHLVLSFLVIGLAAAVDWSINNYPNPTAGQFQQCGMKTSAAICDPDGVLAESNRYRLDHDLKQLESRTRQTGGKDFCENKGVTAAMAIARHVQGASTESVKQMANQMLKTWNLDPQCQKAVVIVVATDDRKFWVARDDRVPVYANEFTEIFNQQKSLFTQGEYQQALTNILQATWEKAISKKSGSRGGTRTGGGDGREDWSGAQGRSDSAGGKGSKAPFIPGWVWVALICVVILTLCCCCCCIYCFCCRGRNSGKADRQRVPSGEGGGGRNGGGNRDDNDNGRLYPSSPVQDEGGGGEW